MKQIQYTAFGNSSVLQLANVEKPVLNENEVLIKIAATTVNPLDMKIRNGFMQKMMPVQLPYAPGLDAAGIVEAVGSQVTRLKAGDEVFATTNGGTYAEYIAINEVQVALKPSNVTLNEAAALAVPLVTAYTLLVETAQLKPGQKILVQGAAGAVGAVMVQMAKALGAYVIATASGAGVELAKELGADEVIDYKTQDFTTLVNDVDVVADLVGGETQIKSFGVLRKGGQLISIVMPPPAAMAEQFGVTANFISSQPSYKKLEFGKQLVEQGFIKPNVAKTFTLDEAAEAQDLVSAGGVNGKVVLVVD